MQIQAPDEIIQIVGQGCKYKYKLRRQGYYMQTQTRIGNKIEDQHR